MALTYTPAGELGSRLPDFILPSVDGKSISSVDLCQNKKALVVMFICNHCPYVKAIEDRLIQLAHDLGKKGAAFVAICSNDPTEYPEDAPAELRKRWRDKNYGFPYLVDADQSVAKAFGAVCTPDIFVYDNQQALCYRGRLDDSWRDPQKVSHQELRLAVEAVLAGKTPSRDQNPSMGCSIKWKTS